jgi:hypothetical protein
MQPMQQLMKIHFAGQELLTGLPEYRNGGLFVDMGVLTLKPEDMERGLQNYKEYCARTGDPGIEVAPMFEPSDDVVVEWRGVTVGLLDRLCAEVNHSLKSELAGHELTLAQVLEAGSWKVRRLPSPLPLSPPLFPTTEPLLHWHELVLTSLRNRVAAKLPRSTGQIRKSRQSSSTATVRCSSVAPPPVCTQCRERKRREAGEPSTDRVFCRIYPDVLALPLPRRDMRAKDREGFETETTSMKGKKICVIPAGLIVLFGFCVRRILFWFKEGITFVVKQHRCVATYQIYVLTQEACALRTWLHGVGLWSTSIQWNT